MKVTVDKVWHGAEIKVQGRKVVNKSAYETGLIVEAQAKSLCAVNWGYLAASITTQAPNEGTEPGNPASFQGDTPYGKPPSLSTEDMKIKKPTDQNEVLVGTPVFYGPYVEFGTMYADGQAFLRPALDLAKGKVLSILEENGKKYLRLNE